MAIWHFDFFMVSESVLKERYGEVPLHLPDLCANDNGTALVEGDEEDVSFVDFFPNAEPVITAVGSLLPEMPSWDEDARMFGKSDGHKVELWHDLFLCRYDVRDQNIPFLECIIEIAQKLKCVMVSKQDGSVFPSDIESLMKEINTSTPSEFVRNPQKRLTRLGGLDDEIV